MYCDASEVKALLKAEDADDTEGENWSGTGEELDNSDVDAEIKRADAQINSALGRIYNVPFNPVPDMIKGISVDIAAYLSDLRYRKSREYESQNYPIIMRYNRAKEILEFLRTGAWTLPIDESGQNSGSAYVINRYEDPLFTFVDHFTPHPSDY